MRAKILAINAINPMKNVLTLGKRRKLLVMNVYKHATIALKNLVAN